MMRNLLIMIFVVITFSRTINAGPSMRTAKAPIATSLNEFETIVKSATELAIESFRLGLSDEDSILSELTSEISGATFNVFNVLVKDASKSEIPQTAALISLAVENALNQVQRSLNYQIEIESIVQEMQDGMEQLFEYALDGKEHKPDKAQSMIIDAIQSTFGTQLFRAAPDYKQQSFEPQETIEKQAIGSQAVVQLLRLDDIEGAKSMFETVLTQSSQEQAVDAILQSLKEEQLTDNLVSTMVLIYSDPNFPIQAFSIALGESFATFKQQISQLLGRVIIQLKYAGFDQAMAEAISYALSREGEVMQVYEGALKYAIEESGCTVVSQLLLKAQQIAEDNSVQKEFESSISSSGAIFECMKVGEELSMTVKILQVLDEPEEAYKLIQEAVEKQQDAAIATSIIEGIDGGQDKEVIALLQQMFQDPNISKGQLALQLSLTLSQGGDQVIDSILQAVEQLKEDQLELIAGAVYFALGAGQADMESTFVNLLVRSIDGKKCGMKPVIDAIFNVPSQHKADQLLSALEANPELEPCIDEQFIQSLSESLEEEGQSSDHPKLISYIIPMPSLPTAVPEVLPEIPLTIGPEEEELMLQFSTTINSDDLQKEEPEEAAEVTTPPPSKTPSKSNTGKSPSVVPQLEGTVCDDVPPPGSYSCEEQADFGKCERGWMIEGGFCRKTCGQCSSAPALVEDVPPIPQEQAKPDTSLCEFNEDLLVRVARLAIEEYIKAKAE